jgi:hypothetical protein
MKINGVFYKRFRYCKICNKRLLSGTGMIFKGNLVHKKCKEEVIKKRKKEILKNREFFKDLIIDGEVLKE